MSSLKKYNEKRNFDKTPEPAAGDGDIPHENRFVIQKHEARRLHYDLRIQIGDALLSWAVPKGPSLDPGTRRLAVRTEDHPVDYLNFEGNIPENNYGAGTMMVWDLGTYRLKDVDENNPEALRAKLESGSARIFLDGRKVQGWFSLYRIKSKADKEQWMLSKSKDEYAAGDHAFDERSVISGRSMEEIRSGTGQKKDMDPSAEESAIEAPMPDGEPMLAKLASDAFDNPGWIFEIKLDGYRILAEKQGDEINLVSRNGHIYNKQFSVIHRELEKIKVDCLMDGEVVVLDEHGRTDFQQLQHLNKERENRLYYYVFDLLWVDGYSLLSVPLLKRKKLLNSILPDGSNRIRYSDHLEEKGIAFFGQMEKLDLEGMIAKRKDSIYRPGKRTDSWLKVKTVKRQEVVIAGYTAPQGSRRHFGSLVMAVNENDELRYAGRVGTGFDQNLLKEIGEKLEPLETDRAPVVNPPKKKIQWVEPKLLAEVEFSEWTAEKIMRHPRFKGLREDKEPEQVKQETAEVESARLNQQRKLSNPEKIFWPELKIRKQDVYDYYEAMAEIILPYLRGRPQSLFRTPDGVKGEGFFQKDVSGLAPDWIETAEVKSRSSEKSKTYMLCQDTRSLLYMVNLGCVEINPWNSAVPELDKPDYVVFDLDPVEVGFSRVVEVAVGFRELFDELELPFFAKTSGSRGMHIYLPVLKQYSHQQAQQFVRLIEMVIHLRYKKLTSFERSPAKRKGKIYLDYLQNGRGKTMASVYSLRPKPGAKVSAPVTAEELTADLDPADFNIYTMKKRVKEKGELWQDFFKKRVDIKEVIAKLG